MSWPLSQDYNEAIQSPASNFADPDLRRGEAASNAMGLPMPYSGNFADVYQVKCPDGSRWAVKCFTREAAGLRERYQEISAHLRKAKLPFTVDFTYLDRGIRVAGTWYPILKMEWVEGLTLNQFVAQYLDKPAMLEALLQLWAKMARYLRSAEVGHCDLQHGNVLLVPGSDSRSLKLKLIDYDGMWVPALAGKKSGEVGHPNYQHPQRLREQSYNIDVDRFPLLLIATALRAVKVTEKALWGKYDNGDNLLFKENDLLAPLKSHLFLDLTKTGDPVVSQMMDLLVKSLRGRLETVPLLEHVIPEAPRDSSASHPVIGPTQPAERRVPPPRPTQVIARQKARKAPEGVGGSAQVGSSLGKRTEGEWQGRLPVKWLVIGTASVAILASGIFGIWTFSQRPTRAAPAFSADQVAEKDLSSPPQADNGPHTSSVSDGPQELLPHKTPRDVPPGDTPPDPPKNPPSHEPPPEKPSAPPREARQGEELKVRELFTCASRHNGQVRTLSLSRDGKRGLSLGTDKEVYLFSLASGAELASFDLKEQNPTALVMLPDGKRALSAGEDKTIRFWDLDKGNELRRCPCPSGGVRWLDVSSDGRRVVAGGEGKAVFFWDLVDDQKVSQQWPDSDQPVDHVRLSASGNRAARVARNKVAYAWDTKTGSGLVSARGDAKLGDIVCADLSSGGGQLAVGLSGGATLVFDVDRKAQIASLPGPAGGVGAVAFSPSGRLLAIAGSGTDAQRDGQGCRLWDMKERTVVNLEGPVASPLCFAFAPDGRKVVCGYDDGTIHVWELTGTASDAPPEVDYPALAAIPNSVQENSKPDPTVEAKTPSPGPEPIKPPAPPVEAKEFDPSDASAVAEARKAAQERFKDDYSGLRTVKDMQALAAKLLEQGRLAKEHGADRFGLFLEARDMAVRGADPATGVKIAEDTAREYFLNARKAKVEALQAAGTSFGGREAAKAFLDAAGPLLEEAWAADDYELVAPLLPTVRKAHTDAQQADSSKAIWNLANKLEKVQKDYELVKPALRTLKDDPDDPSANLEAGRFYCFQKQDWDKGLPLLAKGSDAGLADAAKKELSPPAELADQVKLGDQWLDLGKKAAAMRLPMQRKAYGWYTKALPDLTDKEQERVEKQVIELASLFPETLAAWDQLDLAGAKAAPVGECYIKLGPNHNLSTKHTFTGPVEITVEFRTTKKPPRLALQGTKEVFFECEITDKSLTLLRRADLARGKPENIAFPHDFSFTPYTWYAITCRVEEKDTEVFLAGASVFLDPHKNDLSKGRVYRLVAGDQPVEIKTFTVKPIKP